jgi:hypothetical protein
MVVKPGIPDGQRKAMSDSSDATNGPHWAGVGLLRLGLPTTLRRRSESAVEQQVVGTDSQAGCAPRPKGP